MYGLESKKFISDVTKAVGRYEADASYGKMIVRWILVRMCQVLDGEQMGTAQVPYASRSKQ